MFAKYIEADKRFAFSDEDNGGVEISQDDYDALFVAQAAGMQIVPDDNGYPIAVDPNTLLTPAQIQANILAANTAKRNQLLAAANLVIPALQDAVDLEDPSANPALLLSWKQFRVAVNKVDLTLASPTWPTAPQPGYGAAITAPVSSS